MGHLQFRAEAAGGAFGSAALSEVVMAETLPHRVAVPHR